MAWRCDICGTYRPKTQDGNWHEIWPNGRPGLFLIACSGKCRRELSHRTFGVPDLEDHLNQHDESCIQPLAEYVSRIGNKPLFDYSKDEILGLIKTVTRAWRSAADNDIPF